MRRQTLLLVVTLLGAASLLFRVSEYQALSREESTLHLFRSAASGNPKRPSTRGTHDAAAGASLRPPAQTASDHHEATPTPTSNEPRRQSTLASEDRTMPFRVQDDHQRDSQREDTLADKIGQGLQGHSSSDEQQRKQPSSILSGHSDQGNPSSSSVVHDTKLVDAGLSPESGAGLPPSPGSQETRPQDRSTGTPIAVQPTATPAITTASMPMSSAVLSSKPLSICDKERDFGLFDEISVSRQLFCAQATAPGSSSNSTEVSLYRANGGIKTTVFRNLQLNLMIAQVHCPITYLSEDGGDHDPRFEFQSEMIQCQCTELTNFARSQVDGGANREPLNIWDGILTSVDDRQDPPSTICEPSQVETPLSASGNASIVHIHEPVILIARHDDHNPFFQVSSALNAWVMAKSLKWNLSRTRVVHFDGGYPSPMDELHQKLLSPSHEIIKEQELVGKRVHFHSFVTLPPLEGSGLMMQYLNDCGPCHKSQLFRDFRALALEELGVSDVWKPQSATGTTAHVVVMIISRRSYSGRRAQRMWLNEDEVVNNMRAEYKHLNVVFQSVDFMELTMAQQMQTVIDSDVVIGMHGAGMVNVFWTQPKTLVVEIFSRRRFRWGGYRNLCQFLDCDWHEFRDGKDNGAGRDENAKDKLLDYVGWKHFFDSLFRARYDAVVRDIAQRKA